MASLYGVLGSLGVFIRSFLGLEVPNDAGDLARAPDEGHLIDNANVLNIHGNVGKINITNGVQGYTGETYTDDSRADDATVAKWLEEANAKTMAEVQNDVTVLFPFLAEPKIQETPQLVEFDYYHGCGSLIKPEYTPDMSFGTKTPRQIIGHQVLLEKIHSGVGCENTRHVMLLGSAGAGKTTLVKRYAKIVLSNQVGRLKDVKLVIYMEFKNLCSDERITPREVFMDHLFPHLDDHEKRAAFNWMKKNSKYILFAIDGFDQATWSLGGYHQRIGYESRAEMATIIYNLFNGHLFPNAWLLTSSRDHAIQELEGSIRPNKTIQLAGLSKQSVENLVKEYGGPKGDLIWQTLSSMKSGILSFCTIPVFLVFATSAIYEQDEASFRTDTFSGIMLKVLLNLIHSQHAYKSNTISILRKLQRMAFKGMRAGKVLFRINDLEKVALRYEDVQDLVVTVPSQSKSKISHRFVEGSNVIFFCHQSVQETLAALHVCQMGPQAFEEFVHHDMNKPRWSIVRLLVFGSILHPETSALRQEICAENEGLCAYAARQRRDVLLKNLQSTKTVDLNMLAVLHEAGEGANEAIETCVGNINLNSVPLTLSNMHLLASVTLRRLVIQELSFHDCGLHTELLDNLMTALLGSQIKIYKLDMGGNEYLTKSGFRSLGTILKQCCVEYLSLEDCNLNAEKIQAIVEQMSDKGEALVSLNVCWNQHMDFKGYVELGNFIKKCKVTSIFMRRCDMVARELVGLALSLKDSGCVLKVLDVSENYTLDADCCRTVGEIVSRHHVHALLMDDCGLTWKEAHGLERSLTRNRAQLNILKLNVNKALDYRALSSVGTILTISRVRELHLRHCELTPADLQGLLRSMNIGDQKLVILDIGWNWSLGEEGCRIIGEILSKARVEHLVMDNCEISSRQLCAFRQAIQYRYTEMKTLDLSYNRLRREHIDEFLCFLDKIADKLKLSACKVEDGDWHTFADILSSTNEDLDIDWSQDGM
ncbi:NACHT, LRR and PYD domains-containing protein 14-like [Styela clava]